MCAGATAARELATEAYIYKVRDDRKSQMLRPGNFYISGTAGYLE